MNEKIWLPRRDISSTDDEIRELKTDEDVVENNKVTYNGWTIYVYNYVVIEAASFVE